MSFQAYRVLNVTMMIDNGSHIAVFKQVHSVDQVLAPSECAKDAVNQAIKTYLTLVFAGSMSEEITPFYFGLLQQKITPNIFGNKHHGPFVINLDYVYSNLYLFKNESDQDIFMTKQDFSTVCETVQYIMQQLYYHGGNIAIKMGLSTIRDHHINTMLASSHSWVNLLL